MSGNAFFRNYFFVVCAAFVFTAAVHSRPASAALTTYTYDLLGDTGSGQITFTGKNSGLSGRFISDFNFTGTNPVFGGAYSFSESDIVSESWLLTGTGPSTGISDFSVLMTDIGFIGYEWSFVSFNLIRLSFFDLRSQIPTVFNSDNVSAELTTSVIPLPAALPLFLSGLVGIGIVGRKRRKRDLKIDKVNIT